MQLNKVLNFKQAWIFSNYFASIIGFQHFELLWYVLRILPESDLAE